MGSYVSEKIIKILFAFSGMYLFSRDFLFPNNRYFYVNLSVATLFLYSHFGLMEAFVAGIPLLVYSFLKIRDNCSRGWHWLYIALNPFASSLAFSGLFILASGVIYALINSLKKRKIQWNLLACLFLFALTSAISNYRLFIAFFFDSSYVSHRIEFGRRLLPMVDASLKVQDCSYWVMTTHTAFTFH